MFLWRNKKDYPKIIVKYSSLTSPLLPVCISENRSTLKKEKIVTNSVDPDQILHSVKSDLRLHCLLRPVSTYT